MKRYGDRDWGEDDDYPGRAIVEPLYPPKDRRPWAPPTEAEAMHTEVEPLPVTHHMLAKGVDSIPLIVATALSAAEDSPADVARVFHSVKELKKIVTALEKTVNAGVEAAQVRLLQVMADSGQPTITVETPDGVRRISKVSSPNSPQLREGVERADASQALSLDSDTAHLVQFKYDIRSIRSWAVKTATDSEGEFRMELLPEIVRNLFTFPTKTTVSDNKAK